MNNDVKRSVRLNYLLNFYLQNPYEQALFKRAKQMGVSDATAKDYMKTVILQAKKLHYHQNP